MSTNRIELPSSKKISISFEGQEYTARPLKLGEQIEVESEIDEVQKSKTGASVAMTKILTRCGLPEEMVLRLDSDQMQAVMEALQSAKKK